MTKKLTLDECLELFKGEHTAESDEDFVPKYGNYGYFEDHSDDDWAYTRLLNSCSSFERSVLEEVAGGDYDLAISILYDLRKND